MNREATKDLQPGFIGRKTPPAEEAHVVTPVLYFCLDHACKPFEFVYNGIPLGDEITPDCPGLPESLYHGFVFFENKLQQKLKSLTNGHNELTKTLCVDDKYYTFLFSRFSLPTCVKAEAMISIRDITTINNLEGMNDINQIL